MHVYDPMSSLGHTVWRFLLRRAAGYAAHDLSDEIGANSCIERGAFDETYIDSGAKLHDIRTVSGQPNQLYHASSAHWARQAAAAPPRRRVRSLLFRHQTPRVDLLS